MSTDFKSAIEEMDEELGTTRRKLKWLTTAVGLLCVSQCCIGVSLLIVLFNR